MPNYVYNRMRVYGKEADLHKFKDAVKSDESAFSFQAILPEPEDTSEWKKDWLPGWYNWRIENWDTKWDAWDVILTIENNHLFYEFISAWSGPYNIFCDLIETYAELDFRIDWWESVNDWYCELNADKGEYIKLTYEGYEEEDINDDYFKMIFYKKDFLKKTKHVEEEAIFRKAKSLNSETVNIETGDDFIEFLLSQKDENDTHE